MIEFLENEFDSRTGVYQKWIQGDPCQKIEKMFSMSVFHTYNRKDKYAKSFQYNKYAEYMKVSVLSIIENTTDWYVRIYYDESLFSDLNTERLVWKDKFQYFDNPRIQLICIKFKRYYISPQHPHPGLLPVIFRYLPMFDPNTSIVLYRDVDNIWLDQHIYFTDKWIQSNKDICLFLNPNYKRREMCAFNKDEIITRGGPYVNLMSGIWNTRKKMGSIYPISIWYKLFAYIEQTTDFVFDETYKDSKYYKTRFLYGFEEIAISRIILPIFIDMGFEFYILPVKIYDTMYVKKLFSPPLHNLLKDITDVDINFIENTINNKYWDMFNNTCGLSQYILCIITNIYFELITKPNKYDKDVIDYIKNVAYPNPFLISVGLFTFSNYKKYNWYSIKGIKTTGGVDLVRKFIDRGEKLTLDDFNPKK
jgi:hypothetical protein